MKIAYIHNNFMPGRMANGVQVSKMCQAFSDLGHDTTLIVPHDGWLGRPPERLAFTETYGVNADFTLRSAPMPRIKGGGFLFSVMAALKARMLTPDIVYSRCVRSACFSAMLGMKTIFEMHSAREDFSASGRLAFDLLLKNRNLSRLVTISAAIADAAAKARPRLEGHLCVAPSGADAAPSLTGLPDPFGARQAERPRVGYVGHLYPGKGMELIAPLIRETQWADFHIIGGMEEDIAHWRRELHDARNVTFHGFKANADLPVYYGNLDIFLAPYQRDVRGFGGHSDLSRWMSPLKLFEYMAYAKPILCSDLAALREVVTDEEDVLLCSPDAPSDWARALRRLVDDPNLAVRLGSAARRLLLENYTWPARAQRVIEGFA